MTLVGLVLLTSSVKAVEGDASGPQISVPKDLPDDASHKLPLRNVIDQTREEASRKSRGEYSVPKK